MRERHWRESDIERAIYRERDRRRRFYRRQLDHDLRLVLGDGRARRRQRAGRLLALVAVGLIMTARILLGA